MTKLTEEESNYRNLEGMNVRDILFNMNKEDESVAQSVYASIGQVEAFVKCAYPLIKEGGSLYYLGSGTSGRLGIVDASECPPTFGVDPDVVKGIIAGGDQAIRKAKEFAEDSLNQGFEDLLSNGLQKGDVVLGISASGTTPYVLGALKKCKEEGIACGSLSCNPNAPVSAYADCPIEVVTGPEFLTGSTRLKAGTAQKLVLNMISTAIMIKIGRVKGNKMVDMQLSNDKLIDRGTRMIVDLYELEYEEAKSLLLARGSVRAAIEELEKSR